MLSSHVWVIAAESWFPACGSFYSASVCSFGEHPCTQGMTLVNTLLAGEIRIRNTVSALWKETGWENDLPWNWLQLPRVTPHTHVPTQLVFLREPMSVSSAGAVYMNSCYL